MIFRGLSITSFYSRPLWEVKSPVYVSNFDLSGSNECRMQNAECRIKDNFRSKRKFPFN